jgi:hypothetical protein
MKTPSKLMIAGLAFLASSTSLSAATAAVDHVWTERTSGDDLVSLAYGPPDPAKNPVFLLSCFNEMDVAVLDVHQEVDGSAPGQALTIEVASGEKQAPLKGEVAKNETTGSTFGEAAGIEVKSLLEVLREPGPLTLTMGKTSATLPEQGRAEAVSRFSQGCKVD